MWWPNAKRRVKINFIIYHRKCLLFSEHIGCMTGTTKAEVCAATDAKCQKDGFGSLQAGTCKVCSSSDGCNDPNSPADEEFPAKSKPNPPETGSGGNEEANGAVPQFLNILGLGGTTLLLMMFQHVM